MTPAAPVGNGASEDLALAAAVNRAEASNGSEVVQLTPEVINKWGEELVQKHPVLLAARARTNAAGAEVSTVRTWEDPMLSVGGMAAEEMMRAEDGDLIYGVEQKLPLFGKPKLARRAAIGELAVESAEAEFQTQTLRRNFAQAVFRTALADEIVRIGREDLSWLETMAQVAENRYQAGQATLVDVLTIQNERSRRATLLQTERDRLVNEHVTLNRMLARDLKSPWPSMLLPEVAGPVEFSDKLVDYAMRYEPWLEKLRQQTKKAEAELAVTRRARYPDFNAGVEARNYTGSGDFRQGMLFLSMNLPWFNGRKYKSEIRRDEARIKAAEHERADYALGLKEELHRLAQQIDAARREALLYEMEIVPRSTSALESARAGWESGRNTFRDMLDARRMLLEARLMRARAVSEQWEMLSDLVLCCGLGDLEALQMIGALPEGKSNEK